MEDTPGSKNMGRGLLWFAGGSVVTLVTYQAASGGGTYVVAYGAIFAGAIQFLIGLFQYIRYQNQSPIDRLLPTATLELKAILRTLIASAESDGPLDDQKIELIKTILVKLTGKDTLTSFKIRDVSTAMAQEQVKASQYLAKVQSRLSLDIKEVILRTSAVIMSTGGNAPRAQAFLQEIGQALNLTDQQRAQAIGGTA